MKSREELRNDYEEALFAIIMDDIIELEGEALLAERERLMQSDEDKVPDDVNERCIAFINDLFEQKEKASNRLRFRKVWRTLLVAAIIMSLFATSVCALVPEAKEKVLGFFMDITENVISFSMMPLEKTDAKNCKYDLECIPEEFEFFDSGYDDYTMWETYISRESENRRIHFMVEYGVDSTVNAYDFEDSISKEVKIENYEGLLICKEQRIQVALYDTVNNNFLDIVFVDVDEDEVYKVLYSLKCVAY